jgi:hypothetical protein
MIVTTYTIIEDGTKRSTTSPETAQQASLNGAEVTASTNSFWDSMAKIHGFTSLTGSVSDSLSKVWPAIVSLRGFRSTKQSCAVNQYNHGKN